MKSLYLTKNEIKAYFAAKAIDAEQFNKNKLDYLKANLTADTYRKRLQDISKIAEEAFQYLPPEERTPEKIQVLLQELVLDNEDFLDDCETENPQAKKYQELKKDYNSLMALIYYYKNNNSIITEKDKDFFAKFFSAVKPVHETSEITTSIVEQVHTEETTVATAKETTDIIGVIASLEPFVKQYQLFRAAQQAKEDTWKHRKRDMWSAAGKMVLYAGSLVLSSLVIAAIGITTLPVAIAVIGFGIAYISLGRQIDIYRNAKLKEDYAKADFDLPEFDDVHKALQDKIRANETLNKIELELLASYEKYLNARDNRLKKESKLPFSILATFSTVTLAIAAILTLPAIAVISLPILATVGAMVGAAAFVIATSIICFQQARAYQKNKQNETAAKNLLLDEIKMNGSDFSFSKIEKNEKIQAIIAKTNEKKELTREELKIYQLYKSYTIARTQCSMIRKSIPFTIIKTVCSAAIVTAAILGATVLFSGAAIATFGVAPIILFVAGTVIGVGASWLEKRQAKEQASVRKPKVVVAEPKKFMTENTKLTQQLSKNSTPTLTKSAAARAVSQGSCSSKVSKSCLIRSTAFCKALDNSSHKTLRLR